MNDWYVEREVDGRIVTEKVDLMTGAEASRDRWHVTDQVGDMKVSTVFLALDHSWRNDAPRELYETMVFGGPMADEQVRYATRDEAIAGNNYLDSVYHD